MLKLAVISDSHQALDTLEKLLDHLKQEGISYLAHAGDFMTSGVEQVFAAYPEIKTYIVLGNCDIYANIKSAMRRLQHVLIDDVVYFELQNTSFAISHREGIAQRYLKDKTVQVYIHGHTHQAKIESKKEKLILNPGALMGGAGYMLLDVTSLQVERRFL